MHEENDSLIRLQFLRLINNTYFLCLSSSPCGQAIRSEAKADIEKRLDSMTEQLVDELRRITNSNKEFANLFRDEERTPNARR